MPGTGKWWIDGVRGQFDSSCWPAGCVLWPALACGETIGSAAVPNTEKPWLSGLCVPS